MVEQLVVGHLVLVHVGPHLVELPVGERVHLHDAAVVAILSTERPMRVFRAQHYLPGSIKMVITAADPVARVVHEINAEPAAREYARLVGARLDELGPAVFAAHPPMVRAGGEYYVRSIQTANPDGSLTFYCAIDEGVVLTLGVPGRITLELLEERAAQQVVRSTRGLIK